MFYFQNSWIIAATIVTRLTTELPDITGVKPMDAMLDSNDDNPGCEADIIRVSKALVPPPGRALFRKPLLAEVADVEVDLSLAGKVISLSIHWIYSGVKGTSSLCLFGTLLSLMAG